MDIIEPFKVAVVEAMLVVELVETADTVEGVTGLDALDADPVPTKLVAVTVNVYGVPLTKPVTVCVRAVVPALESVPPDELDMTV